eukprot:4555561-Alexandrium_andersonii.AAC.1
MRAGSSGKTCAGTNTASADTELARACNWALMQNASASALFPPLTRPRHARTPGWDGGRRSSNT